MRSIDQLLAVLDSEAIFSDSVGLLVVFPAEQGRDDALIFPESIDRAAELSAAISAGGEPIGFLAMTSTGNGASISTRAFPEYANDPRIVRYLKQLSVECWFIVQRGSA